VPGIAAVIFDLDGVIVDSEAAWGEIRERFTRDTGGNWKPEAVREMQGMSSVEWSRYMRDELGVPLPPLLPGAVEAVRRLAAEWPLAVASSANRHLIELVIRLADVESAFAAIVSSEEVERGKPAPDVYLEAARRLEVDPEACAAVEDSTNGLRSAHAAGMAVIAVPNRDFAPAPEALELADLTLDSLQKLTVERVRDLRE